MKRNTPYVSERIKIFAFILCILLATFIVTLLIIPDGRLIALIFIPIFLVYAFAVNYYVVKPYIMVKKTLGLVINGYTINDINTSAYSFSPEYAAVMLRLVEMINDQEMINTTKKQAEFLALQNQINPHFLYNTLESIRSEALIEGVDSVANVTEKLATFYRYTISKIEKYVTIQDELNHINDYMTIQKFRFGDKLNMEVMIEPSDRDYILHKEIPKLLLQPIVENAVFHGIERKIGKGTIRIRFVLTENRIIITISDDGIGMSYGELEKLRHRISNNSSKYLNDDRREGGIALINVNNRIKLIFGESYGMTLYSTPNVGTDVEVSLPLGGNQNEA